jgi:hypothetical protein
VVRRRWLCLLLTTAIFAAAAVSAHGSPPRGGPLTGTWSGYIGGSGVKRQHMLIVVNARQTGGSWRISNACQGPLTLDSISGGYHHYRRRLARGSTCRGGDIDCLKRVGANVYDAVTSKLGGKYNVTGTLRRVRAK